MVTWTLAAFLPPAYEVSRRLCFQRFCSSVHRGGVQESALWAQTWGGGGGGGLGVRESALLAHSCYKSAHAHGGGGGVWVSGKVHSEHILATKVLMPVGGGGKGGWVSGRMQYSGNVPGNEHILALAAWGMQSIFELPSCLLIGCERAVSNRDSNCLLVV